MLLIVLLLLSVVFIVVATTRWKLHPFLALLLAAFGYGLLCRKLEAVQVVEAVNAGFGGTVGSIGIVILAGSIIGVFLERSGGAYRLAERTLKITGERNVPLALGIIGYIVSIPVFCDSGFVLLAPLARALSRRAGISLAGSAMALSLGLYATHTMVPPTPGPVAAAGLLGADLGLVILWGLLVSAIAFIAGWLFAAFVAARTPLDAEPQAAAPAPEPVYADAPSAGKALLPIVLPIVLIVLSSISALPEKPFGEGLATQALRFAGQPVVALLVGVFLAFRLPKTRDPERFSAGGWVGDAILTAATIIVITGAGGAFGKVLQTSGIAEAVKAHLGTARLGIWLPFLLAAALKTAQGSSTVAIITTAGIMAPLLEALGLDSPTARALVVVAIGAGSMVVSHVNDSYFWVVTQLTRMTVKQGFKLQTLGTLIEGVTAALTVWAISVAVL
jgi:GntP family gluconate:H+ symporter